MSAAQTDPDRPDPIMSLDGAFFWKAAEEGRFVAQKCCGCGALLHPPRSICPNCLCFEQAEQELSGRGTVMSWVMPIHPPARGFETPPIVVLIEVEEGLRFVSNVVGVAPEDMKIGMKVKVGFAKTQGGKAAPIFHADLEG